MSARPHEPLDPDTLRDHIRDELLRDPTVTIGGDQDLLLSGLLDSLSAMRLVGFVESRAGIEIPPEDVVVEHFGSLNRILAYVAARTG